MWGFFGRSQDTLKIIVCQMPAVPAVAMRAHALCGRYKMSFSRQNEPPTSIKCTLVTIFDLYKGTPTPRSVVTVQIKHNCLYNLTPENRCLVCYR